MATQELTLHLPDNIYRRLQTMAQATRQPLEAILFQTIQGNLPPLVEDLPVEWQDDLAELQSLADEDLWAITQEPLSSPQWQRHQDLLELNQNETLSEVEQHELRHLRTMTDLFVFRRSYALALLKWRGHTLPQ